MILIADKPAPPAAVTATVKTFDEEDLEMELDGEVLTFISASGCASGLVLSCP